jgi:hypothetical protein
MRLFVALAISDEIRASVAGLIRELRGLDAAAKWVRPEQLHVTLKFIGEISADQLPGIGETLETVKSETSANLLRAEVRHAEVAPVDVTESRSVGPKGRSLAILFRVELCHRSCAWQEDLKRECDDVCVDGDGSTSGDFDSASPSTRRALSCVEDCPS